MKNDPFFVIFIVVIILMAVGGIFFFAIQTQDCDAKGGALVRGGIGYACVSTVH